jgi:hypothetical protein
MLLGIVLFPYCGCKGSAFSLTPQIFRGKFFKLFLLKIYFVKNLVFSFAVSGKSYTFAAAIGM